MWRKIGTLLGIACLFSTAVFADLDDNTFSAEKNPPQREKAPYTVSGEGNYISRAKITNSDFKGDHFSFSLADVDLNMVFYYKECYKEGLFVDVGYLKTYLNWKRNPFFTQRTFNNVNLTFGGFSERLENWRWLAQGTIYVDIDHFNISEYAYYDLILWGKYRYRSNSNFHIGIFVETGMKIDRVYPIIGIDWTLSQKWEINAVFPLNVSVVYKFDRCWSASLAGRAFDVRQRTGSHQPLPRALFTYRAVGGELALGYDCDDAVTANIHAGYTFGGVLKIANRHYEDRHRFNFDPSAYAGANVDIKF